jgi:hypothetical protein
MSILPRGLNNAFQIAAGELGMFSASCLFVKILQESTGRAGVEAMQEELGVSFPVVDFVAMKFLAGESLSFDAKQVANSCANASKVLVVGLEADCLDALVPLLDAKIGILTENLFEADWERVLSNYRTVEPVPLASLQQWAGNKSSLLTFIYGADEHNAHVLPVWLRVSGPDVRVQFRDLIGWNLLGPTMRLYPRWLSEASVSDFSRMIDR